VARTGAEVCGRGTLVEMDSKTRTREMMRAGTSCQWLDPPTAEGRSLTEKRPARSTRAETSFEVYILRETGLG
jgi:hypothetical protein